MTGQEEPLLSHRPRRDPSQERDLACAVRKVTFTILPPLFMVNWSNYVDRTNLSYAYIRPSFQNQLAIDSTQYGWGSGVFYASYVAAMPIASWCLGRMKHPQRLLGAMAISWGLLSLYFAFISSPTEFYILRLLLGAAESSAFPGAWYYMSCFIPNSHLTVAVGILEMSKMISLAMSAPLALWIFQLDGKLGLYDWQYLFIIESIPPVLSGAYIMFALPSDHTKVRGLSSEEHVELQKALPRHSTAASRQETTDIGSELAVLLRNWRLHYVSLLTAMKQLAYTGLFYFLPIVVQQVVVTQFGPKIRGREDDVALGVTAVIWLLTALSLMLFSNLSQAFRAPRTIVGSLLFFSGCLMTSLMMMDSWSVGLQLAVLTASIVPLYSATAALTSMMLMYVEGTAAASSSGYYNAIANLGGLLGPVILGAVFDSTGSYQQAFLAMGLPLMISGIMAYLAPAKVQQLHELAV